MSAGDSAASGPAMARVGAEHVLITNVFRHTDRQPLANYRVRYRLLDGPPAGFQPGRLPEPRHQPCLGGARVLPRGRARLLAPGRPGERLVAAFAG